MRLILLSWVVFTNIVFEDLKRVFFGLSVATITVKWFSGFNFTITVLSHRFYFSQCCILPVDFFSLIPPSFFLYICIQHTLPRSSLALSLLLLLFIPYISLSFSSCTFRLNNTAGQFKCDSKLEISLLNYFKSFKKIYMVDTANTGMSIVPGGTYVMD